MHSMLLIPGHDPGHGRPALTANGTSPKATGEPSGPSKDNAGPDLASTETPRASSLPPTRQTSQRNRPLHEFIEVSAFFAPLVLVKTGEEMALVCYAAVTAKTWRGDH
jgi:hypothetical protein